jgi:peptidoglycan/LPS O-acetylase OafA/YrhL
VVSKNTIWHFLEIAMLVNITLNTAPTLLVGIGQLTILLILCWMIVTLIEGPYVRGPRR